ncbi:MAG: hypothetical protein Edafosvirus16_23, partial [Edafosvirus sp.]
PGPCGPPCPLSHYADEHTKSIRHMESKMKILDCIIEQTINDLNKKMNEQYIHNKELEKRIQILTEKLGQIDDYELITK